MRRLSVLLALTVSAVFAQQTSPTGFGRALYPGTGGLTAPLRGSVGAVGGGAGFGRIIYPGTGAPAAVRPGFAPGFGPGFGGGIIGGIGGVGQRPAHLQHGRSAIVPFPVFYGGGYYGGFEPPPVATAYDPYYDSAQRPPLVIINQNFQPDTPNPVLRDYSNTPLPQAAPRPAPQTIPQLPPQAAARDPHADDPTIYQIALTDGTVFEAVGYWVEGNTLNYLTIEGVVNRATLDLVDRERSKKLNDERKVEFRLPKR